MAAPYKNLQTNEVVQLDPAEADEGIRNGTLIAVHQSRPDQDEVYADPEQARLVPPSIGGGARAVGPETSGGAPAGFDVSKPAPPGVTGGNWPSAGTPHPEPPIAKGGKGKGDGSFNPKDVAKDADKPDNPLKK